MDSIPRGLTSRTLIFALTLWVLITLIDHSRFAGTIIRSRIESFSALWQTVIIVFAYGLALGLSIWGTDFLPGTRRFRSHLSLEDLLLELGVPFALTVGFRARNRSLGSDIRCVETLRWSWIDARKGCVSGSIVFPLLIYISTADADRKVNPWSFLAPAMLGALIGAFFTGLRGGIKNTKAVPNLGIKLTVTNMLRAVGIGVLCMVGFIFLTAGGWAGYVLLELGPIFTLFAFVWFGGQDVIQHYTLRFILYWKGYAPLRYANFLDYAARLVFLQKVGGGYIFIHRLLLEHFAAMEEDETHFHDRVTSTPLRH